MSIRSPPELVFVYVLMKFVILLDGIKKTAKEIFSGRPGDGCQALRLVTQVRQFLKEEMPKTPVEFQRVM